MLFSIVKKAIGKKVHFCHNKDQFCSCFFILTTNFAKNGYLYENKKLLYLWYIHIEKKFYRRIFLKCGAIHLVPTNFVQWLCSTATTQNHRSENPDIEGRAQCGLIRLVNLFSIHLYTIYTWSSLQSNINNFKSAYIMSEPPDGYLD